MPNELTSNLDPKNNVEKEVPSLYRIRVEEAATDPDSSILGMDYPAGVIIGS